MAPVPAPVVGGGRRGGQNGHEMWPEWWQKRPRKCATQRPRKCATQRTRKCATERQRGRPRASGAAWSASRVQLPSFRSSVLSPRRQDAELSGPAFIAPRPAHARRTTALIRPLYGHGPILSSFCLVWMGCARRGGPARGQSGGPGAVRGLSWRTLSEVFRHGFEAFRRRFEGIPASPGASGGLPGGKYYVTRETREKSRSGRPRPPSRLARVSQSPVVRHSEPACSGPCASPHGR